MTADKKLVERNLDLIFEFEKYVLEHPEINHLPIVLFWDKYESHFSPPLPPNRIYTQILTSPETKLLLTALRDLRDTPATYFSTAGVGTPYHQGHSER